MQKLPFKKLTEALELIPKPKEEQTLKLSKESVEEFAEPPSLETQVYVGKSLVSSGKQIFDWNEDSELLFKEPDDFTCYTQMISYYSKDLPVKDDALQAFIVALKATIFIMKRQAAVFLQTQMAKEETFLS